VNADRDNGEDGARRREGGGLRNSCDDLHRRGTRSSVWRPPFPDRDDCLVGLVVEVDHNFGAGLRLGARLGKLRMSEFLLPGRPLTRR
jgi:hypothetical protein